MVMIFHICVFAWKGSFFHYLAETGIDTFNRNLIYKQSTRKIIFRVLFDIILIYPISSVPFNLIETILFGSTVIGSLLFLSL